MSDIFQPINIGGVMLRNSVLRAATEEAMADSSGFPSDQLATLYERLAKGGVGGIITGYMGINRNGRSPYDGMCLIDKDDKIEPLRDIVKRVHALDTPIIVQIAHCGRNGAEKYQKVGKFTDTQIEAVISDFVQAVRRAKEAEFDAAELHCAHGYLLSEFLSPKTNHRCDKWGGSVENRFRIVREIMLRVREQMPDFPVWAKINGMEGKGITPALAAQYARLMQDVGINAVEVSCGLSSDLLMPTRGEVPFEMLCHDAPAFKDLPHWLQRLIRPLVMKVAKAPQPWRKYNVETAKTIKNSVDIPVIAVGGIHDLQDIQETLADGIDAVAISRPLVLEPNLVSKYQSGKQTTARCIACNYCVIGIYQRPLRCYYGRVPKHEILNN